MDLQKLKKMTGRQVIERALKLLKKGRLTPQQISVVCRKWLELQGYHYNGICGWTKKTPKQVGVVQKDGKWFVAVQKNPRWDDDWEGDVHYTAKETIHRYLPLKHNQFLEDQLVAQKQQQKIEKAVEKFWQQLVGGQNETTISDTSLD